MNEKEKIEYHTALKFLEEYNKKFNKTYTPCLSDSPDVICKNFKGEQINLEVTLTEDNKGDIPSLLGRSDQLNIENVNGRYSSLSDNVSHNAFEAIKNKMHKRYGKDTALVVRDVSPVGWDWGLVTNSIRDRVKEEFSENPYSLGIWILSGSEIHKIL